MYVRDGLHYLPTSGTPGQHCGLLYFKSSSLLVLVDNILLVEPRVIVDTKEKSTYPVFGHRWVVDVKLYADMPMS